MKFLRSLLLTFAVLALCAGTASAAQGRLDRSFGESGIVRVATPKDKYGAKRMAIGPEGRVYLLDSALLLAFKTDGAPAAGFGEAGKVKVTPASGKGESAALAVDPQGRVLVAGTVHQSGQKASRAYVVRFLPDGSRDITFGDDGEVDSGFELPPLEGHPVTSVRLAALTFDAQGRPIVGGSFVTPDEKEEESCDYAYEPAPHPFVARLTSTGALDGSFAGSGYEVLEGQGGVESLTVIAAGGFVAASYECSTPPRFESRPPNFTTFGENGETSPLTTEQGHGYSYLWPVADPQGRVLEVQSPPPAAEGSTEALVRCGPDGRLDPFFGRRGRVVLRDGADVLAVDAASRPLVAMIGPRGVELERLRPNGKLDRGFGPHGRLEAPIPVPRTIEFDSSGRIYVMGVARNGAVTIARFLPGS